MRRTLRQVATNEGDAVDIYLIPRTAHDVIGQDDAFARSLLMHAQADLPILLRCAQDPGPAVNRELALHPLAQPPRAAWAKVRMRKRHPLRIGQVVHQHGSVQHPVFAPMPKHANRNPHAIHQAALVLPRSSPSPGHMVAHEHLHLGAVLVQERSRLQRGLGGANDGHVLACERREIAMLGGVGRKIAWERRHLLRHTLKVGESNCGHNAPRLHPLPRLQRHFELIVTLRRPVTFTSSAYGTSCCCTHTPYCAKVAILIGS